MLARVRDAVLGLAAALAGTLLAIVGMKRIMKGESTPAAELMEQNGPRTGAPIPDDITDRHTEDAAPIGGRGYVEATSPTARVPELKPGWSIPQPVHLSRPTYWPAVMSFGIVLLFWAVVTSPVMLVLGLVLFGVSLAGWIGEVRQESHDAHEDDEADDKVAD